MLVFLFAFTALSLFSCNSGNAGQAASGTTDTVAAAPKSAYDLSLAKGMVTDSIICRKDNTASYALYLPSYYDASKPFPCIFFFDAHARGSMPVRMYKDIAERYGFVLAGSNNSKNGTPWPTIHELANTTMQDARSRINIDPKRIYAAGFSGGSRVASTLAIIDGGIAGVIGSAAGFPQTKPGGQRKFDYFGIVGNFDFNLTEMVQLDAMLQQNGFAHQLLTTGNIHGWPSAADFQTGLLWMQVNGMKEQLQPKNDTLISALKKDFDTRIAAARSSGDLIRAYVLTDGAARTLDGLMDVTTYKKQAAEMNGNAAYKNAVAMQTKLQQVEQDEQQDLQRQFAMQDLQWWTAKIADLNANIKHAKTQQESQMYQRLLNYLGLISYLYCDNMLKTGNIDQTATFLKVFKMADPKNPDVSYLSAVYYMDKGQKDEALTALNDAAAAGYSEVVQLITQPAFGPLLNDPAFKTVLDKVIQNGKGK